MSQASRTAPRLVPGACKSRRCKRLGDISPMRRHLLLTTLRAVLCAAAAPMLVRAAGAQETVGATPSPQWELRADWIAARSDAAHLGVGMNLRTGWYARVGGLLALGVAEAPATGSASSWTASQRADLTVRFLLDPFAERPRGFYGGAGITARHDGNSPVDARLLVVLGIEGRPDRPWRPSLELGLGGGLRLGVVLRPRRSEPAR